MSGRSPETRAAAGAARRAGVPLVAVTARADSPLAAAVDDVVLTPVGEETGAATKSELSAFAALAALAAAAADGVDGGPAASRPVGGQRGGSRLDHGGGHDRGAESRLLGAGLRARARRRPSDGAAAPREGAPTDRLLHAQRVPSRPDRGERRRGRRDPRRCRSRPERQSRSLSRPAGGELAELGVALIAVGGAGSGALADPAGASPAESILHALLRVQQLARIAAVSRGTYREDFLVLRGAVVGPADDMLPAGDREKH